MLIVIYSKQLKSKAINKSGKLLLSLICDRLDGWIIKSEISVCFIFIYRISYVYTMMDK